MARKTRSTAPAQKRLPAKRRTIDAACLRTWIDVADFLVAIFPGCERETAGREVVRVAGKVLAYPAANQRSRPSGAPANEAFVIVRMALDRREHLLELYPDAFFVTPHYQTYPGVIVRLSTVDQDLLKRVLTDGWRLVAPKRLVREWDSGVAVNT